jgi:hypothetical protein
LWTTTCSISGSSLSPACCWTFCLSSIYLLKFHEEISSLPPRFSNVLTAPHLLCCVFIFSSLFIVQFFFCGVGVSLPSGLCWFIPGVTGGIPCGAWCSPVGLWNVSQAGLESVSGSAGALLFSQCNMAWRIFLQANSSGY